MLCALNMVWEGTTGTYTICIKKTLFSYFLTNLDTEHQEQSGYVTIRTYQLCVSCFKYF